MSEAIRIADAVVAELAAAPPGTFDEAFTPERRVLPAFELSELTGLHVKTSPYYPQSNGKIERWHGTLKSECIRPGTPLSLHDARRIVGQWIGHYNTVRLHSAIDYIAPKDKLEGRAEAILAARDAKLAAAREQRRIKRQQLRQN